MNDKAKLEKIIERINALKHKTVVTCSGNSSSTELGHHITKVIAEYNNILDNIIADLRKESSDYEPVLARLKALEPKETTISVVPVSEAFAAYVKERNAQKTKVLEEIIADLRKVLKKK